MSNNTCALCASTQALNSHQVLSLNLPLEQTEVTLCKICLEDIELIKQAPEAHWRCLSDSMWSPEIAVQVLAWRQLTKLSQFAWASSLLDMMYLEEDALAWAQSGLDNSEESAVIHKDANGVILSANDSVTIIKDLPVKGSSMVAKRGTVVRKISLVLNNAEHIEGRVEGQKIVILTKFVKKS